MIPSLNTFIFSWIDNAKYTLLFCECYKEYPHLERTIAKGEGEIEDIYSYLLKWKFNWSPTAWYHLLALQRNAPENKIENQTS